MTNKEEIVKYCHKVYEKGFVAAYDGNLSARIDDQRILITPSGVCKGEIEVDNIIEIDNRGNKLSGSGKISTENKIHLMIYNKRPDINAVMHCHPVHATAMAAIGETFDRAIFPEVVLSLGKIPLCKYATPSSEDLPNSLLPFVEYSWVFLLENHGAVTIGKNLKGAFFRMEKLEHAAKTLFVARCMGREKTIPLVKLKELYSIAESIYGIRIDKRNRLDY